MQFTSAHAQSDEVEEILPNHEAHEEGRWISMKYFSDLVDQQNLK